MDNSVMEVILPSFATVATSQTTELRELMAKVASLKRQISNLQATGRCRSNNGSNRGTQFRFPSLHTSRQQTGKRATQQLGATGVAGPTHSRLFYITDRTCLRTEIPYRHGCRSQCGSTFVHTQENPKRSQPVSH